MARILIRAAEIGRTHTGQAFAGTENVLRAMIEDGDGVAAHVLDKLGVAERIAARLDEIMRSPIGTRVGRALRAARTCVPHELPGRQQLRTLLHIEELQKQHDLHPNGSTAHAQLICDVFWRQTSLKPLEQLDLPRGRWPQAKRLLSLCACLRQSIVSFAVGADMHLTRMYELSQSLRNLERQHSVALVRIPVDLGLAVAVVSGLWRPPPMSYKAARVIRASSFNIA